MVNIMINKHIEIYRNNLKVELEKVLELLRDRKSYKEIQEITEFSLTTIEEVCNRFSIEYSLEKLVKNRIKNIEKALKKVKGQIIKVELNVNLEGTIYTTEARYSFYSVQAQGYIQRLHNRFLVKEIKQK